MRWASLILLFLSCTAFGQEQPENFWPEYDKARLLIAKNKPTKAIKILTELNALDSANPNVHYLLGVANVLEKKDLDAALSHLQLAEKSVSHLIDNSGIGPAEHVYYFLIVAYVRLNQCEKALEAFDTFTDLSDHRNDDHLIKDGKRWAEMCEEPTVKVFDVKDALRPVESDVETRPHRYTTHSSLYGVQVGALLQPQLSRKFEGLKNVEAFTDLSGVYRYVIGNFIYRSQAEKMLMVVKDAGYPSAFIVDITDDSRFGHEVLTVDGAGVNEQIHGPIEYMVQVAAFEEPLSEEVAGYYLMLDDINELTIKGLTTLNVGSYKSFGNAIDFRNEVRQKGFSDAFVIAMNNGRRIPLDDARKHQVKYEKEEMNVIMPK
ncbi:MAG: tetratricopeptide (TPR) repeat protein [Flavobacteriales bacterium]|jgi:tetratricopeptide (TPR) repeat protein